MDITKANFGRVKEGLSVLLVYDSKYMPRKKGICYCNQRTDACSCSYEQHVLVCKNINSYKFIMITFPEKLWVSPSA